MSARITSARAYSGDWLKWTAALLLPLALLLIVQRSPQLDPEIEAPTAHFVVVSLVSAIGAVLAVLTGIVAHQSDDSRVLLLSLAFFTVSGFFLIHGVLTPYVLFNEASSGEGWSTLVGLVGGATLLALSSLQYPPRVHHEVLRFRRAAYWVLLLIMIAAFLIAVRYPDFIMSSGADAAGYGEVIRGVLWGLATLTIVLLAVAAWRYIRDYRLARLRLLSTVTVGLLLLIDAEVGLAVSSAWHFLWWVYHWLVLLGFTTILFAIVYEVGRGATLFESVQALFIRSTVEKLERNYNETIVALINSVEARDAYTRGHSIRVAEMATHIGEALGLSPEQLRMLHQSALLHDVGKIGVPDAVLNKQGPLTDEEFGVIEAHPAKGEAMIRAIPSLRETLPGIRSHHERLDGRGYPDGLRGDEIPLQGRIIAVADVFDAMTSDRAYRRAHSTEEALGELHDGAGTRYDPRIVEVFLRSEAWTPRPRSRG